MTTVILITGYAATGKTTLAQFLAKELRLPQIRKDQIKELLLDTLGTSTISWSRQLSSASWALLYQQVENLLKANMSHIVESNFDPIYANEHWQILSQKYEFRIIQVRCETEPEILLKRYSQRIKDGDRHLGHVDASKDEKFLKSIKQHMGWVETDSTRISFYTSEFNEEDEEALLKNIETIMQNNKEKKLRKDR